MRCTTATQVFDLAATRWLHKASDIARIVWTDKMFERWLMWESYLALWDANLYAEVEPHYNRFCLEEVGGDGDVVVMESPDGQANVFVEIGLINDQVLKPKHWPKTIKKHARDHGEKLPRLRPDIVPLHIIAVATYLPSNLAKLTDLPFWEASTSMDRRLSVPAPRPDPGYEGGITLMLRGWSVPHSC